MAYFKSIGENYKAEIIESIPEIKMFLFIQKAISLTCAVVHVPSTGKLKVFKLMKLAGAYWRGDSKKTNATTCVWNGVREERRSKEQYLHMLEEAEKRDHRKLGKSFDLFHFKMKHLA